MLAAVLFDMDGTLFDTSQVVTDAFIATVAKAGGEAFTPAEIIEAYALGPPRAILEHLLGRATDADLEEYHSRLRRDVWSVRPYRGIPQTLERIAAEIPIGLLTGADLESVDVLLGGTGLRRLFTAIVGGDEVPNPKPAPDGPLLACARLGVEPSEAAYVGDSPLDVGAARAAGLLAIGAAWGHLNITDADVILERPEDLLDLIHDG